MAEHHTAPAFVCERCPFDAGLCLGDNWRTGSRESGGLALRFSCHYLDFALDAPSSGLGPWQVTDEFSGSTITGGEALCADHLVDRAAAFFKRHGWFSPHDRETIAQAIDEVYRSCFGDDTLDHRTPAVAADAA